MSKTDRAHIEGIVVAKSIDGEIVGGSPCFCPFPHSITNLSFYFSLQCYEGRECKMFQSFQEFAVHPLSFPILKRP